MKNKPIIVCIDANVYISAFAFGGKPSKIIEMLLLRKFYSISSLPILTEVKRNLIEKLDFSENEVNIFLDDIMQVSSLYEPTGKIKHISHVKDNLVIETAILGNAHILVTGDKKDLLPLKVYNGIVIEPPSAFIARLEHLGIF